MVWLGWFYSGLTTSAFKLVWNKTQLGSSSSRQVIGLIYQADASLLTIVFIKKNTEGRVENPKISSVNNNLKIKFFFLLNKVMWVLKSIYGTVIKEFIRMNNGFE